VVIANLSGSYDAQTKDLARVMSNLQQESSRQAMTITPVQLAGNEIYQILKKRLFTELPDDALVDSVAEAFAEQVKAAEDGGYITARAMEAVAEEVRETYPFHPSFKNLVALFKENEGFFKETENLGRRIERDAKQIPAPKLEQALINRLTGLFKAQSKSRAAYREVQIMPRLDDVKLSGARILLVVQPDGGTPPEQIREFFEFQQEKNNVLILSGNDSHLANEVEIRLRELYAIERIHHNLKPGDTLFDEARDKLEELEERFTKAVSGAYNRLFFPGPGAHGAGELVMATIDNGLSFGDGEYAAEAQIERLLASGRCDNKLALDMLDELPAYWAMAETYLWPASDRRVPWRDLVMRAKTDPSWPWLPGARGLEQLRDEALKQGRWRQTPEGHIEKGPFPAEKTSVNVTPLGTNRETGETTLSLTRRNAGDSPRVYVLKTNAVSEQDEQVQDLEDYRTTEATLYFIAVDSTGKYETGPATRWTADLTIRHEIHKIADNRKVELRCTPPAELRFTLDGTNAKEGKRYSEPFPVPAKSCTILIAAKAGELEKAAKIQVPADGDDRLIIDDNKPARIPEGKRVAIDTTDKAFGVIQRFRDREDILLRGVQILIGDGESAVQIRFNDRALTAGAIETAIRGMREAIGDEQAGVQVTIKGGIAFGDGFALKEFAEVVGIALNAGDVIQDEDL
jgi:hypothetical protein